MSGCFVPECWGLFIQQLLYANVKYYGLGKMAYELLRLLHGSHHPTLQMTYKPICFMETLLVAEQTVFAGLCNSHEVWPLLLVRC